MCALHSNDSFIEKIARNGIQRKEDASGRRDSLIDGVSQFPPDDEFDVLFLK
jgi:hypothetical protein